MNRLPHAAVLLAATLLMSAGKARIPALDAAAPAKIETATFAMG